MQEVSLILGVAQAGPNQPNETKKMDVKGKYYLKVFDNQKILREVKCRKTSEVVFDSVSVLCLQCYQYCSNCTWLNSSGVSLNFQTKNICNQHSPYTGIGGRHTAFSFHLPVNFTTSLHYSIDFDFLITTVLQRRPWKRVSIWARSDLIENIIYTSC